MISYCIDVEYRGKQRKHIPQSPSTDSEEKVGGTLGEFTFGSKVPAPERRAPPIYPNAASGNANRGSVFLHSWGVGVSMKWSIQDCRFDYGRP